MNDDQNTNTDEQNVTTQQPAEEQAVEQTPAENQPAEENPEVEQAESPVENPTEEVADTEEEAAEKEPEIAQEAVEAAQTLEEPSNDVPGARWYVVHTYSGHENRVAATLKQRVESEHLEDKIVEVLVPTQEKIEIKSGKKATVKEKIFPGYILVKMVLDDLSWLAVRTTQGVTSFIGMGSKPTPISEAEVKSIVNFMQQGNQPTYKQIFSEGDTVKIVDGPFAEFIGKVDSVDKERGKVKVLVSIFGRETPVELDFLQVNKL